MLFETNEVETVILHNHVVHSMDFEEIAKIVNKEFNIEFNHNDIKMIYQGISDKMIDCTGMTPEALYEKYK